MKWFGILVVFLIVGELFAQNRSKSRGSWPPPIPHQEVSFTDEQIRGLRKVASLVFSEVFLANMALTLRDEIDRSPTLTDALCRLREKLLDEKDPSWKKSKKADPREWFFGRHEPFSRIQLLDGYSIPHPLAQYFPRMKIIYEGRIPTMVETSMLSSYKIISEVTSTSVKCGVGTNRLEARVFLDPSGSVNVSFTKRGKPISQMQTGSFIALLDELRNWVDDRNSNEEIWDPKRHEGFRTSSLMRTKPPFSEQNNRTLGEAAPEPTPPKKDESKPPVIIHHQKPNASKPSGSPLQCPTCWAGMVERTNSATGVKFWGCSRFPTCRGTRNSSNPNPRRWIADDEWISPDDLAQDWGFDSWQDFDDRHE